MAAAVAVALLAVRAATSALKRSRLLDQQSTAVPYVVRSTADCKVGTFKNIRFWPSQH
jgi:hypothetical protein